ncbi:MAG: GNAT family N-acetyltransferase [Mesorhizobium sp.]
MTSLNRVVSVEPVIPPGALLGRIGDLEVRLARNPAEIAAAQKVRFKVFVEELGARLGKDADGHDIDAYDAYCDHLLVLDTSKQGSVADRIVGTYRLLRQDVARAHQGFYSAGEFQIDALVARHPERRFLELGRSCVLPEYRTKRTVELLWQGIWAYARRHSIDVMVGCASFPGIAPAAHALALSFLAHHSAAQGDWHIDAKRPMGYAMDLVPVEAVDMREALAEMPPLIKGYLRLGAKFGHECVVDVEFGTTDVFVVLPVESIADRYLNYYGADATRFAA